jgi:NADH-quinone oxidoreductase subunit G
MPDPVSPAAPAGAPAQKPSGPPPPKNPGFVTLTIDGVEVVAKPGTNLIEAANQIDVEIPFYCYHHKLSIAANCRMCLVRVSNSPKLQPGCQTLVSEGLVVQTQSADVRESHRSVQEMLLYNHPVDCAICDQAGECKLQDYYMEFDHLPYRPAAPKVMRHKRKEIGPRVLLDQERCILCTRCVRFMREVPNEPQLGVFGRGNREYIDTFPGVPLTSKYSLNTVDICPVGALLPKDFRFKARAFFLSTVPSVCSGCSRGCNTSLDFYDGVSYRYRPRENDAVNGAWMCDDGRGTVNGLNENRVTSASVGRGSSAKPTSNEVAFKAAAEKLAPYVGASAKPGLAALVSPQLSIEDLLMVLYLAKEGLGLKKIYVGGLPDGDEDKLLIKADKNPNRTGLTWVAKAFGLAVEPFSALAGTTISGKVKALYAAGLEVPLADPSSAGLPMPAGEDHAARAAGPLELLIAQGVHQGPLAAAADVLLPAAPHSEYDGLFVNFDGRAQRFQRAYAPQGNSQPHWKLALHLAAELGFANRYGSARELFLDLSPRVPELKTVRWDDLGPSTAPQVGLDVAPAAADARPPGYRERVVELNFPKQLPEAGR